MRKFLIGVAGLLVLLVVAALVAPFLIPTDTYKNRLVALVTQSTGREFKIAGPVKLSFLPQLEIEASDVSLANVPGAQDPAMLQLKEMQVELRLLPLLGGNIELGRFVLNQPVISLEVMKDGRPNWVFATTPAPGAAKPASSAAAPAAAPRTSASLSGLSLEDVRLVGGRISYRDDRTGKSETVDDINMKLSLPDLDSKFSGEGSATWNGETVSLSIGVAKPDALLAGRMSGLDMHVTAKPIELGFTGQSTGLPPAKLGGAIDLTVPSLRELAKWVGSPLPPGGGLGPLSIKGKLDMQGPRIAFTDAAIAVDDIKGTGAITVETGGARPAVKGQLQLEKLDLNPYLPPENAPAASKSGATGGGAGGGGSGAAGSSGWSDAPIDFAGLSAADADFDLRAGAILYRKITIGSSALDLHLKDAKLTANLSELNLYQGKGTGFVTVDGSGSVPALALKFDLAGVQVEPLLQAAAGSDRLSGVGKLSFDVTGHGASQRAIVSALNGKGAIDLVNGQVKGVNLIALAENATSALTGSHADDKTDFGSLTGTFTITNGVLHNTDLLLKSGLVPVTGAGTANLPERTADYRVVVSPAGTVGIPILVRGPWDHLSYQPDLAGIVQGIGQAPGKALDQLKNLVPGGSSSSGSGGGSKSGDLLKSLNPFGK
jgi:AsmA protein